MTRTELNTLVSRKRKYRAEANIETLKPFRTFMCKTGGAQKIVLTAPKRGILALWLVATNRKKKRRSSRKRSSCHRIAIEQDSIDDLISHMLPV
jgi:hypothetical protein